MPTPSLSNWLTSMCSIPFLFDTTWNLEIITLMCPSRQNPAVLAKADRVFGFIVQALDAGTLQGQTALRVAQAAKQLVAATNLNAESILAGISPENQERVRKFFQ